MLKNKKYFLRLAVCIGIGTAAVVGTFEYTAYVWHEHLENERVASETFQRFGIRVTRVDDNYVLYPGTERKVETDVFMNTYTSYKPTELTYKKHTLDALGLSFTYPEEWVLKSSFGYFLTIAPPMRATHYATGIGLVSHFSIERYDMTHDEELKGEDGHYHDIFLREQKAIQEPAVIGGLPADKYTYYDNDWHNPGEEVAYLIKKGKWLYIIHYEKEINLTPEFEKILASLKFEDLE